MASLCRWVGVGREKRKNARAGTEHSEWKEGRKRKEEKGGQLFLHIGPLVSRREKERERY